METVKVLEKNGAKQIFVGATHGILSGPAIDRIKESNVTEVILSNTVPITDEKKIDKITILSIAPLFTETIKRLNEGKPLGELLKNK